MRNLKLRMIGAIVYSLLLMSVSVNAQERESTMTVTGFAIEPSLEPNIELKLWFEIEEEILLNPFHDIYLGLNGTDLVNKTFITEPISTKDRYLMFFINKHSYGEFLDKGFDYVEIDENHIFYFNDSQSDIIQMYFEDKTTYLLGEDILTIVLE